MQADNLSLLSPGRNTIKGKHIEEPASRFSHFLKVGKAFGKQSKENELFLKKTKFSPNRIECSLEKMRLCPMKQIFFCLLWRNKL